MTDRQTIEEAGFEALQHLYEVALGHGGQCRTIAGFLLSLYNGARFPFDLTELRGLDDMLFQDCMTVLRMDSRLAACEVHTYFSDGGRKFEDLANTWRIDDVQRLRADARRAAQPEGAPAPVHERGRFEARVKRYGDAPGYRDVTLVLGLGENENTEIAVHLSRCASVDVMLHIAYVHAFCWSGGRGPLDADEGERRPSWLDQTPAQHAGHPATSEAS